MSDAAAKAVKGPDRIGQAIGLVCGIAFGVYMATRAVTDNGNSWFAAALVGVLIGAPVAFMVWKFVGALRSFLSGDFMDDVERLTREARDRDKAKLAAATAKAQAAAPAKAPAKAPAPAAAAPAGARPAGLDEPRGGERDDLKRIKGVGPKLEAMLNAMGYWHYDQIAGWTEAEIAWVDANLEGFKGRVTRDEWVAQARTLAAGGETEFSKRMDESEG